MHVQIYILKNLKNYSHLTLREDKPSLSSLASHSLQLLHSRSIPTCFALPPLYETSTQRAKYYPQENRLSPVFIWSLRSLRSLRKKSSAIAVIIAIFWKPLSSDRSDRSDNDRWDRKRFISATAEEWFSYDHYDRCDRWTFFSQRSKRSYGNRALRSKNNFQGITMCIGPIWGIHSLSFILS